MKKIALLFLFTFQLIAQSPQGFWDKDRITSKEITVSAGNKITIKSEDFPIGTTEIVYRITLLDENQKMTSDLASVLKAIPDPFFIGKGLGGAISLTSAISGTDKCTYAIFNENKKVLHYNKTNLNTNACVIQNNPINKEAKLLSLGKSACLNSDSRNLWFVFKSENWVMNQKIVLEIVPWVDTIASRGWSAKNKEIISAEIEKNETLNIYLTKNAISLAILQKIEKKYRYYDFVSLNKLEKDSFIQNSLQEIFTEKPTNKLVLQNLQIDAATYNKENKYDKTILLLENSVIENKSATNKEIYLLSTAYLYTKQFDKALNVITTFEKNNETNLLLKLNLSHVYMFLNNSTEAKNLHKKYSSQNVNTIQTWKNKAINDINEFEKAQLPNENFAKFLRLLD